MKRTKYIALVAHDNRKKDLIEWVEYNWQTLVPHELICTGTTGRLVQEAIEKKLAALPPEDRELMGKVKITRLKSGPLGGDQQLGSLICENKIDIIIFLWDPMEPQPHDVDVKALLRIAVLYNVVTACTRSTADFVISSELFNDKYEKTVKDYSAYINRDLA